MAKTVIQKKLSRNGDLAQGTVTFQVNGGDTLSGADFQFLAEDGVTTLTFIPRRIDVVVNTESGVVAIDGKNYASGTWNLHHDVGGVPCSTSITVGVGNIMLQLRS